MSDGPPCRFYCGSRALWSEPAESGIPCWLCGAVLYGGDDDGGGVGDGGDSSAMSDAPGGRRGLRGGHVKARSAARARRRRNHCRLRGTPAAGRGRPFPRSCARGHHRRGPGWRRSPCLNRNWNRNHCDHPRRGCRRADAPPGV